VKVLSSFDGHAARALARLVPALVAAVDVANLPVTVDQHGTRHAVDTQAPVHCAVGVEQDREAHRHALEPVHGGAALGLFIGFAIVIPLLSENPALQGKVVLEVTIAPSGEVTDCKVISSELGDPELERKLVARVKMFRFEERDVAVMTTTKPIEFFPA
jgi:TonB family protein